MSVDKARHRAKTAAWHKAHAAERRAWAKAWRAKNKDKLSKKQKAWREKHPEKKYAYNRGSYLKATYDVTLEQYAQMALEQNGVCAICHQPETLRHQNGVVRALSVDHDRATSEVRALLCAACNTLLGGARDSVVILLAAVAYLKRYQKEPA